MADDVDPMMREEIGVEQREPFWSIEPSRRTSFAFWFWFILSMFILGLCVFNWSVLSPPGMEKVPRNEWTNYTYFLGFIFLIAGSFVEIVIASFIMTFVIFEGKVAMTYAEKMLQDARDRVEDKRRRRRNLEAENKELRRKIKILEDRVNSSSK